MNSSEHGTRQAIIDACQRMTREGLVTGTAGNISVRVGSHMLITPSGQPYELLTVDDICLVELSADLNYPPEASSESPLHRTIYERTAAKAVVHFHGLHSIAVSNTMDALPVEHYYAMRLGGEVRVAPYARFGSAELANHVGRALEGKLGALMQNHGGVGIGRDLNQAYANASLLEWLCNLTIISRTVGSPRDLTSNEVDDVDFMFERSKLDRG